MKLFSRKNSNSLVTIEVLHRRPGHAENVTFIRTYCARNDPELDLKTIFFEAFSEAHPEWPIMEIHLRNEK